MNILNSVRAPGVFKLLGIALLIALAGCATARHVPTAASPAERKPEFQSDLDQAEVTGTGAGVNILKVGRKMVDDEVVVQGGCWDFINEMFRRAGFAEKNLHAVFKSHKGGPYASVNKIQPGDWLYYINHSYGNIEHSGVFVSWSNLKKKEALVLSYRGEKSSVRGRYSTYILNNVYRIMRAE
jgi:hypothetical protein